MSRKTAYKWLGRFDASSSDEALRDRSRRPKRSPSRTLLSTERRILELHASHGWPLRKVLSQMVAEGMATPSLSTAYRILTRNRRSPAPSSREPWLELLRLLLCDSPPRGGVHSGKLSSLELKDLVEILKSGGVRRQRRAAVIILVGFGLTRSAAAELANSSRGTVKLYWDSFREDGIESIRDHAAVKIRKAEDPEVRGAVFRLLHSPPSTHDINRTTWRMKDLNRILRAQGTPVSTALIREIIRSGGYKWKKAKKVLTSPDPNYKAKLLQIQRILSNLGPDERFFSIDEFGPCSIKMRGGRRLAAPGDCPWIPQRQKSKGSLIVTAALELSRNQVTHFYSQKKNTREIIKLLKVLLDQYRSCRRIYLSWDAASWHASKTLYGHVEQINHSAVRDGSATPVVELAPLPSRAQFLNVIESVFSGMARAVIHNSNYNSLDEAKVAIDRHFEERNAYFLKYPRKAGKKIWGEEQVPSAFSDSQNCKNPRWRG
jgi:transposase